jgi:putative transposase
MSEQVRTFKYRLYPNREQSAALDLHLAEGARLYNAALQERRDAWRLNRRRVGLFEQQRQLKDIRAAGDTGIVDAMLAHEILKRVDHSFAAFFRRVRSGAKPGYPRFRSAARFDTLPFRKDGYAVRGDRLYLHGIGAIKMKLHRPIPARPKAINVTRQAGKWYACCAVEAGAVSAPLAQVECVGIDVGLSQLATLSTGEVLDNPRWFRAGERQLRQAQRRLSRAKRRSKRREKVRAHARAAYLRTARQRADYQHKASRAIVNTYGLIAAEDLNIRGLARTKLAKSIHDAGWRSFLDKIAYKAANAGRQFVLVDARGTSQRCLCGASVPKTLKDRWHSCAACGLSAPRDLVSAQIIERLGRSQQAQTISVEAVACGGVA